MRFGTRCHNSLATWSPPPHPLPILNLSIKLLFLAKMRQFGGVSQCLRWAPKHCLFATSHLTIPYRRLRLPLTRQSRLTGLFRSILCIYIGLAGKVLRCGIFWRGLTAQVYGVFGLRLHGHVHLLDLPPRRQIQLYLLLSRSPQVIISIQRALILLFIFQFWISCMNYRLLSNINSTLPHHTFILHAISLRIQTVISI